MTNMEGPIQSLETSKEKIEQVVSPSAQLEAAKMLEIEAQKRGERVREVQERIAQMQLKKQAGIPKIELDLRPEENAKNNPGRIGSLRAAERAWSTEKTEPRKVAKPIIPPPPARPKGFFGGLFS